VLQGGDLTIADSITERLRMEGDEKDRGNERHPALLNFLRAGGFDPLNDPFGTRGRDKR